MFVNGKISKENHMVFSRVLTHGFHFGEFYYKP